MNFIDPFNNVHTISGQGTLAKEMLEQAKSDNVNFDYLFAAIGGGGLISGISTHFKSGILPTQKLSELNLQVLVVCTESVVVNNQVITLPNIDKFVDGASVARVGDITLKLPKM